MLRRVQVPNLIVNTEKIIFNLENGFSIQECTQVGDFAMKFFSILFLILIFRVCQNGWKKEKKHCFSVELYLY